MIWLEVVLGFAVPIGFGIWQLLDLRREKRRDAAVMKNPSATDES